jgi:hypothetical protein
MRSHHAGRAKPWFELAGGTLVEHAPAITWHERVRDHSYLLSAAAQAMEARLPRPPPREFEPARDLYRALLIQEAAPLTNRGVSVLLAHHGDHPEGPAFDVRAFFDELCTARFRCLALDDALSSPPGKTRQSDGHWNAAGHRAVSPLAPPRSVIVISRFVPAVNEVRRRWNARRGDGGGFVRRVIVRAEGASSFDGELDS